MLLLILLACVLYFISCAHFFPLIRMLITHTIHQKEFSKFMVVLWLPKTWLSPKIRRKCLTRWVSWSGIRVLGSAVIYYLLIMLLCIKFWHVILDSNLFWDEDLKHVLIPVAHREFNNKFVKDFKSGKIFFKWSVEQIFIL